jgi:hypothetical protein
MDALGVKFDLEMIKRVKKMKALPDAWAPMKFRFLSG